MRLSLAERFLLLRRRMGITQTELAAILLVSRRTIVRVERNECTTDRSTVDRFKILESRHRTRGRVKDKHDITSGMGTVASL